MAARAIEMMRKSQEAVKSWLIAQLSTVLADTTMLTGFQTAVEIKCPYLAIVAESTEEEPPESGCHAVKLSLELHSDGVDGTQAQHEQREGYIDSEVYRSDAASAINTANASMSEFGATHWRRGRVTRSVEGSDLITTWEAELLCYAAD